MTLGVISRCAVWGSAASLGCSGAPARSLSLSNTGTSTPAIIFSAGKPCQDEPDIQAQARSSAMALGAGLRQLGFSPVTVVTNPSRTEILDAVHSLGPRPGLVAYSGHGAVLDAAGHVQERCAERGGPCHSALCLADNDKLTLDEVVAEVAATTELAVLLIDACSSAHVDLRLARAPLSVISASPFSTSLAESGRTPLSDAFARLATDLDLDCDARLADWELFNGLNRLIALENDGSAMPKLRRQIRGEAAPLLRGGHTTCWPERKSRSAMLPDGSETYACESGRCSRIEGFVAPQTPISFDGKNYPANVVAATPCADDTGQCFRLTSGAATIAKSEGAVR